MAQPYKFLRVSATVFQVLAWLTLFIQVVAGLFTLVQGGPAVPFGGAEMPARLFSIFYFLGAALNWFLFMFISKLTRLLLEVHSQVTKANL